MDMNERDECSSEKNENHLNFHNAGFSSGWQFRNPSVGIVAGDQRGSMEESFNPSLWKLCESDMPAIAKPVPATSRFDDDGWTPPDSSSRGGSFLPGGPAILSPTLSHFPADSAFIKRAARFSCFNAASLGGMATPFGASHLAGAQIHNIDINMAKDASLHDVDPGEAADLGGGGHETADSSSKDLAAKKRRRPAEVLVIQFPSNVEQGDPQMAAAAKRESVDTDHKAEQSSSTAKPNGKHAKDASDAPKEDYIHVRARRGQATNSHSLAERVRFLTPSKVACMPNAWDEQLQNVMQMAAFSSNSQQPRTQ
ncbi:hypothetical protein GW17_00008679 [Ensete ventricosum]|nr:hypothetical protein GW17_00008679 [Ensete ventricosum]